MTEQAPSGTPSASPSIAGRIAAVVLFILGFLPWYNWLPTGHDSVGYGWMEVQGIFAAAAIAVAVLLTFLSQRIPALWHEGLATRVAARVMQHPRLFALDVAIVACGAYLIVSVLVFGRHPADVDDAVQLLQARAYAHGTLWQALGPHPEFLASTHDVVRGTRSFAQFPPGNAALLALGVLLGAPWVVVPVTGGIAAYVFARLVQRIDPRPTVAVGAALLFPFTPIVLAFAGSEMNHVPTMCALLLATHALALATRDGARVTWGWALGAGLALGAAATLRPLDALAYAIPAALWLLARALRDPARWVDAIAAGVGVLIAAAPMLVVNARTTGHPLMLGYTALWGPAHNLGFHQAPYGPKHTPARGFALVSFYFILMQQALFASPIPSLAFVVGGLALSRRLRAIDAYLLASAAALCLGYWAYWYRGLLLGPRFLVPIVPVLVLWAARLPAFVRECRPGGDWHRIVVYSGLASLLVALFYFVPLRFGEHHRSLAIVRTDLPALEREQEVDGAVVIVREHWGNSLVARLWALGVPHPDAARAFDDADLCRLDALVSHLENSGADTATATDALRTLLGDSLQTHRKVLPGTNVYMAVENEAGFTPHCVRRAQELMRGGLPLANMRVFEGRNVYVRDLHARDTLLAQLYPGRPLWVLEPGKDHGLVLAPLNLDSARADWHDRR